MSLYLAAVKKDMDPTTNPSSVTDNSAGMTLKNDDDDLSRIFNKYSSVTGKVFSKVNHLSSFPMLVCKVL